MRPEKIFLILALVTIVLMSCNKKMDQSSMRGAAETFIQALIDGDIETIDSLNLDPNNTSDDILSKWGPDFAGLTFDDITLEYNEEQNSVYINDKSYTFQHRLYIELIGDKYYVTSI